MYACMHVLCCLKVERQCVRGFADLHVRLTFPLASLTSAIIAVGDAGLMAVTAPFQILKNAVVAPTRWFKPKTKFENPDYMYVSW
jgi:hypothetical protein